MQLLTDNVAIHDGLDHHIDGDKHLGSEEDPMLIRFSIPEDCRTFTPFTRLPPEIRHKIWACTLTTPGMHFLKVAPLGEDSVLSRWWKSSSSSPQSRSSGDDEEVDEIAEEVKCEKQFTSTTTVKLVPLYPTPEADISYYTTLNKELAKLSVITPESAAVAEGLASRSSVLKLGNGRVISLDSSADVIYLEYVPPDVFSSGCTFTQALHCPEFQQIRQLAIRYCHGWYEPHSSRRCPHCGRFHGRSDRIWCPDHLYKFLAQYLPNLEHFYFVDYLILRKPSDDQSMDLDGKGLEQKRKRPSCAFQSGNRKYYEAEDENWNITSKVFEMKSWLEDRFVRYAQASKLSNHKRPLKVKFGVLACEWAVTAPVSAKASPVKSAKKGRNKRAFDEEHTMRKSRQTSYQKNVKINTPITTTTSLPFTFGASEGNDFEFTFSMPL